MKRIFTTLMIAMGITSLSNAQVKTTGVVTVTPTGAATPITIKLDMDNSAQKVFMTATGPSDRAFFIGFDGNAMKYAPADPSTTPPTPLLTPATDGVAFTKLLACDQLAGSSTTATPYIAAGAYTLLDTQPYNSPLATTHLAPVKDPQNDWTVISDNVDPTTHLRTVNASRALNTGDTQDYIFDYNNLASLPIIWAEWTAIANASPLNTDDGYWALSGKNTIGTTTRHASGDATQRGTTTLSFATLGIADNAYSEKIAVYPNPAKGIVNILANNSTSISTIKIFDINAKLLKVIQPGAMTNNLTIDISNLQTGNYFMEISNDHDKTVKKILKE